jgi:hypothetical protein
VLKVWRSGAAVEPDIAATQREGHRRRRLGVLAILERVHAQGALADHLALTRAADLAVALMTDDVCDALVDEAGWSYDEYEEWLAAILAAQLLRRPAD